MNFALGTQPKTYENKIEKEQRKIARRERKDRKRILDLKETDVVNQIKIESETVELDVDTNDVKGSEEKRRRRNQSSPVRNERRMSKSPMKSVINDRHVRRERSAEKQRRDSRERSDRNGNQSRDERDGIRSKRSSRR